MTMLLDREYFNSGDKFILTMSNSERTNHFHRYGLKYLRDFNAIINPKQKFISSKQKINFIFEQLHLQTPNCFEVEDIEVKLEYTQSSILKEMLFSNKEDAYEFDCALIHYLNNPKAINEFKMAGNYPSINAMQRAIETNEFQNQLGRESERLILACENMVCGNNGINEDDCYRIPLMYIFNKIYKNDN